MVAMYYFILVFYSFLLFSVALGGRLVDIIYFLIPVVALVLVVKRRVVSKLFYTAFFVLWFFIEVAQSFYNPLGGLLYSLIYSAVAAVVTIIFPYLLGKSYYPHGKST